MQLGVGQFRLKTLGVCLVLSAAGIVGSAFAGELSYETRGTERFEYDSNIFLSDQSSGDVFGSLTSVAADIAWAGPARYWKFHSDAEFRKYFGAGADDGLDALNHHHGLDFHKEGPQRAANLSATLSMENAAESELRDTGFTREESDRLTFAGAGDMSFKLNSTNAFTLGGSVKRVDFTDDSPNLVPFLDYVITGSWTHQINEKTAFSTDLSWELFDPDNIADEETHNYKVVGRVDKQLRESLTLNLRGGANIRTDNNSGAGAFDLTDSTISGLAGVDLKYVTLTKTFTLSAAHDLVPSASGELQQRTSVSVDAAGHINSRSQLGLSAEYQHQEASGTTGAERDFFAVSPLYSIELARRWNAGLGYSFKLEDEAGDISTSHKTFVSLTRKFSKKTCSAACVE